MIRFNQPYLFGPELDNVEQAIDEGRLAGNGDFTKKCQRFFEERYGFKKCLLTTSCTDALEMAALLLNIQPGDEVIMPSYTFVSTSNAFVLRGANIVFADSCDNHPNLDADEVSALINDKTRAIVVVHYGGVACDMDAIMRVAERHDLFVVEDAAQAIDAFYKSKPLGSIGHLAAFSFHETKNIVSGEGGMLVINDEQFVKRAEVIWEKGTNRAAFFRGEIDKYGWVDVGSSFLPSELVAAYLYGQLHYIDVIQEKRRAVWNKYLEVFKPLENKGLLELPVLPDYATNNAHVFYLVCKNGDERGALLAHLKEKKIGAVFHYLSLHKSPFYHNKHDGRALPHADRFSECLLRLPLHLHLTEEDLNYISNEVLAFYDNLKSI
ncbi:MAG: dTDP-4-amino-4,6-dideoxygalactose transaminase [Salibacteraceae bacterium]